MRCAANCASARATCWRAAMSSGLRSPSETSRSATWARASRSPQLERELRRRIGGQGVGAGGVQRGEPAGDERARVAQAHAGDAVGGDERGVDRVELVIDRVELLLDRGAAIAQRSVGRGRVRAGAASAVEPHASASTSARRRTSAPARPVERERVEVVHAVRGLERGESGPRSGASPSTPGHGSIMTSASSDFGAEPVDRDADRVHDEIVEHVGAARAADRAQRLERGRQHRAPVAAAGRDPLQGRAGSASRRAALQAIAERGERVAPASANQRCTLSIDAPSRSVSSSWNSCSWMPGAYAPARYAMRRSR